MLEIIITWLLTIISSIILMTVLFVFLLTFLLHSAQTIKPDQIHIHRINKLKKLRINILKTGIFNTALLLLIEGIIKFFN